MTRPTLRRAVPDTFLDAPDYNWNFDQILDYTEEIESDLDILSIAVTGSTIERGMIVWLSVASAPDGYLICNGAAISRTDYSDLFAKIGTTFGAGDSSTTFNLPDLINKILKGGSTVNQINTTYWTTEKNLNHTHSVGSSGVWTNSGSALGNHNHNTTLPTVTLLPCIKY